MKMYLYRAAEKRQDIPIQLSRASGISEKSKSRPHGFDAIVNFDFGDIFIDDVLFSLLNDEVSKEVDECLKRIIQGDYGQISVDDIQENNESRYFGNGDVMAKYEISEGFIQIEKIGDKTLIRMENQYVQ